MQRVFSVDVLRCSGCGGRHKILAAITQADVIRAILAALGLPSEPPVVHMRRIGRAGRRGCSGKSDAQGRAEAVSRMSAGT